MKAKQHTLIVLLVFVLAAGAALALLTHANQKAEQAASEAEDGSIPLLDGTAATLESVGLGERLNNFPAQLSGGEQQRVSIARALAKNPKLLLCDEPTGALDYKTGKQVLALLQDTCRRTGRTVIVITHNTALTAMADRIIQVRSGKIVSNQVNEHPVPVQEIEW